MFESTHMLNIAIVTPSRAWDWTPAAPRFTSTHFARVDLGRDMAEAKRKAADFAARFPEGDKPGEFKLQLTFWNCAGHGVEFRAAQAAQGDGAASAGVTMPGEASALAGGLPEASGEAIPGAAEFVAAVDAGVTFEAALPSLADGTYTHGPEAWADLARRFQGETMWINAAAAWAKAASASAGHKRRARYYEAERVCKVAAEMNASATEFSAIPQTY